MKLQEHITQTSRENIYKFFSDQNMRFIYYESFIKKIANLMNSEEEKLTVTEFLMNKSRSFYYIDLETIIPLP